MSYKSVLASTANAKLRVPTLGLAGVVAMAATAGPAARLSWHSRRLFRSRRTRRICSRAGRSLHSTSASPTR